MAKTSQNRPNPAQIVASNAATINQTTFVNPPEPTPADGWSHKPWYDNKTPAPAAPQAPEAPRPTVVQQVVQRQTGGWVITYNLMSDGSRVEVDRFQDFSARDAVLQMFTNAGLDSTFTNQLLAAIDGVYAANVAPTDAQILNSIYNSDAYKQRFKANEEIRKRLADGKGRPGDRLLTPKEYIDLENSYREVLAGANMPTGYYDSPDDFTTLISNGISVAEMKSRVDTAYDALNMADDSVKNALQQFYGLTTSEMVAYLLDPTKATPILLGKQNAYGINDRSALQKGYEVAAVGGDALRVGLDADRGLATEIVDTGQSQQAAEAFGQAAGVAPDLKRLGAIYEQPLDASSLVRETLNLTGGAEAGRRRRRLASKERAAFAGQGAVDKTSLTRQNDV